VTSGVEFGRVCSCMCVVTSLQRTISEVLRITQFTNANLELPVICVD
jgi:hypothetical protein